MHARRLSRFLPLLAVAVCLLTTSTARAQSDLAKQNVRLKEQVVELEKRLERADQQIKALSAEVRRLRAEKSAGGNAPKTTAPGTDDAPAADADPFASPDAFIAAVRANYNNSFGDFDPSNRREKTNRIREVRRWAGEVKRKMQSGISWDVMLDASESGAIGRIDARFRLVNAESGEAEGEAFVVRLSTDKVRALKRADASAVWSLEGLLTARIGIEPDRVTADDDGRGIFVGAMAELFFDIRVDDLRQN